MTNLKRRIKRLMCNQLANVVSGVFLVMVTGAVTVLAQEAPKPEPDATPTPKPPVKRRVFDQFDLSGGIGGSSSNAGAATAAPVVTEFVDQSAYEGIAKMVKYAAQIETEYRLSEGVPIDPSDYFEPYRVLSRKLPALFRITEIYRAGLLDQPAMTNPANIALLDQNQQIVSEMQMISNSTEAQLAKNQAKLLPIAEQYGVLTAPIEKRPLLSAMFSRLNGNFSRLMSQVTVRK